MAARFLVPDLDASDALVTLPAEEAHHAARVMRLTRGTPVMLFDGMGRECAATLETVGRDGVTCRRGPVIRSSTEPLVRVTLVQSALAGGALDEVVRNATMLGAVRIEVVCPERSQISAATIDRRNLTARWRRVAVASAKQCGRAVVPSLHVWHGLDEALRADRPGHRILLAEPSVAAAAEWSPRDGEGAPPDEAHVLVGPEGGWTGAELERAKEAGWRPWRLGPRTLRADAAGAVALSVLLYEWSAGPSPTS